MWPRRLRRRQQKGKRCVEERRVGGMHTMKGKGGWEGDVDGGDQGNREMRDEEQQKNKF